MKIKNLKMHFVWLDLLVTIQIKIKLWDFVVYQIAIGAKYLVSKYKYKKIAIIDFDVHHGNGTQDIMRTIIKMFYIYLRTNILIILEQVQIKIKEI